MDRWRRSCAGLDVFVEVFAGQGAVLLARVIEPQSFVNGLGHFSRASFCFPEPGVQDSQQASPQQRKKYGK
jgi:hypothetical protein